MPAASFCSSASPSGLKSLSIPSRPFSPRIMARRPPVQELEVHLGMNSPPQSGPPCERRRHGPGRSRPRRPTPPGRGACGPCRLCAWRRYLRADRLLDAEFSAYRAEGRVVGLCRHRRGPRGLDTQRPAVIFWIFRPLPGPEGAGSFFPEKLALEGDYSRDEQGTCFEVHGDPLPPLQRRHRGGRGEGL